MNTRWKWALILSVLLLISLACSISINDGIEGNTGSQPENTFETSVAATVQAGHAVETAVAATQQAGEPEQDAETPAEGEQPADEMPSEEDVVVEEQPAAEDQPPQEEPEEIALLPHPLYFLRQDVSGRFQVWRLSRDGKTASQFTFEPANVDSYAVSPIDGSLAYISNNQLLWIAADSSGRRILVDGGPIEENNSYYYHRWINSVAWAQDGRTVAYGCGGLNLYDMNTGTTKLVVENTTEITNEYELPRELYSPNAYSPDGTRLLLNIGWFEGGTYGVLNLADYSLVEFAGQGIVCCDPVWSFDSSSILAASPWLGLISSGMWRFNPYNGDYVTLLPTTDVDGSFNYAGWPIELPNNSMQFFFHNSPEVVDGDITLTMVVSSGDAVSGRTPVRGENFLIHEALWAPSGAFAVAVLYQSGDQLWPAIGTATLIPVDGSPLVELVEDAYELRWGP